MVIITMTVDDHERSLVGRVRAWDALIILLLVPVGPLPLISRLSFFPLHPLWFLSHPVFTSIFH